MLDYTTGDPEITAIRCVRSPVTQLLFNTYAPYRDYYYTTATYVITFNTKFKYFNEPFTGLSAFAQPASKWVSQPLPNQVGISFGIKDYQSPPNNNSIFSFKVNGGFYSDQYGGWGSYDTIIPAKPTAETNAPVLSYDPVSKSLNSSWSSTSLYSPRVTLYKKEVNTDTDTYKVDGLSNINEALLDPPTTFSWGSREPGFYRATLRGILGYLSGDEGPLSNTIDLCIPPSIPNNVIAISKESALELVWSSPTTIGGTQVTYNIQLKKEYNSSIVNIGSPVTTTATTYKFENLNTDNNPYYFATIYAFNHKGSSTIISSNKIYPLAKPLQPTFSSASPSNREVSLTWTPPSGPNIATQYAVTINPGGLRSVVGSTTFTRKDLSNGVTYTAIVAGINSCGEGPASTAMSFTPRTQPSTVTPTATVAAGGALVSWTAPYDGGSPILGYIVKAYDGTTEVSTVTVNGLATSVRMIGLSEQKSYTFKATPFNALGTPTAPAPSTMPITPTVAILPSPPHTVQGEARENAVYLHWSSPLDDGGAPITEYTITATSSQGAIVKTSPEAFVLFDGLLNDVGYTFTITATSAAGTSGSSTPAGPFTPISTFSFVELYNSGGQRYIRFKIQYKPLYDTGEKTQLQIYGPSGAVVSYGNTPVWNGSSYVFTNTVNDENIWKSGNIGSIETGFYFYMDFNVSNPSLYPGGQLPASLTTPMFFAVYVGHSTFGRWIYAAIPGAPQTIVEDAGMSHVRLTWSTIPAIQWPQEGSGGILEPAGGYRIMEYKVKYWPESDPTAIITKSVTGTSILLSDLSSGVTYGYSISAINSLTTEGPSATGTVQTRTEPTTVFNNVSRSGISSILSLTLQRESPITAVTVNDTPIYTYTAIDQTLRIPVPTATSDAYTITLVFASGLVETISTPAPPVAPELAIQGSDLSWNQIPGCTYILFRNGAFFDNVQQPPVLRTSLPPAGGQFTVVSVSAKGQRSTLSNAVSVGETQAAVSTDYVKALGSQLTEGVIATKEEFKTAIAEIVVTGIQGGQIVVDLPTGTSVSKLIDEASVASMPITPEELDTLPLSVVMCASGSTVEIPTSSIETGKILYFPIPVGSSITLTVGEGTYAVTLNANSITVNGSEYGYADTFMIDGKPMKYIFSGSGGAMVVPAEPIIKGIIRSEGSLIFNIDISGIDVPPTSYTLYNADQVIISSAVPLATNTEALVQFETEVDYGFITADLAGVSSNKLYFERLSRNTDVSGVRVNDALVTRTGVSASDLYGSIQIPYTQSTVILDVTLASSKATITKEDSYTIISGTTDISFNVTAEAGNTRTYTIQIIRPNAPVPCIAEGQRILTPAGYRRIEELRQGDLIKTADGRHVKVKLYSTTVEKTTEATAPIRIGGLRLSPNHAFKVGPDAWMFPRVAVKHGLAGAVQETPGSRVVYYHVETPNYLTDNLMVEGREIESFGANYVKKNGLDAAKIYYQAKDGLWFHRIKPSMSQKVFCKN